MAAATKEEIIHPFVWVQGAVDILKDAKTMGLTEFDEGLATYLKKSNFHLLPGGVPPIEIWESTTTGHRFTIVAKYATITIAVQVQDARGLRSFMEKYLPVAAILPEIMLPEPLPPPSNHYYSVPHGRL